MEFDEHVIVLHALDRGRREVVEYPSLARVGVDAVPDGLAGLLVFREAMPIGADLRIGQCCHGVKDYLVLARPAMPHGDKPVMRPLDQRPVELLLIPPDAKFNLDFSQGYSGLLS